MIMMVVMVVVRFFHRDFGNQRFGRYQQRGDAGRILQGSTHDLCRIDDTHFHQVTVGFRIGVVTLGFSLEPSHPIDHHGTVDTCILGDRPRRIIQTPANDLGTECFVSFEPQFFECFFAANQSGSAPGNHPFLKRRMGGGTSILQ